MPQIFQSVQTPRKADDLWRDFYSGGRTLGNRGIKSFIMEYRAVGRTATTRPIQS